LSNKDANIIARISSLEEADVFKCTCTWCYFSFTIGCNYVRHIKCCPNCGSLVNVKLIK